MPEMPPFRADHVGSFLRPQALLDARAAWKAGRLGDAEIRAEEDRHIADVVRLQESLGLRSITDGEFRRENFHRDFLTHVIGLDFKPMMPAGEEGRSVDPNYAPFVAHVHGRLGHPPGGIEVDNYRTVAALTSRTPKITIPSPTMTHFRSGRELISRTAYPDMAEFFADLARVHREEIGALAAAGCRYVQFDDTNLAYLCDPNMRAAAAERGEDPDELPATYATLINESISGRPADFAVCVHLCRGNAQSKWFASGGYEPVAEKMFGLTRVDGYFLEYDDDRSGDFAPLRFVPKGGPKIVLGLVTTKRGALESKDALKRRIDEAARYVPLEQLCLSPQCGFSSNAVGNLITPEEQAAKVRLVVETAAEVWGP